MYSLKTCLYPLTVATSSKRATFPFNLSIVNIPA